MDVVRVFRTRGLPILQQLRFEEAILRTNQDNWLIINDGCRDPAIVLGISGDPHKLAHVEAAKAAGVQLIKRFSGGGTVVVDSNTIFCSLVFQQAALPDVAPFPGPIMQFTGDLYADVFATASRNPSRVPRTSQRVLKSGDDFKLHQNDYTFGDRKVGGNAQAIIKSRWLHHTSFLWDYQRERMALLQEPVKRPEYRGPRTHGSFLCPLVSLGFDRQEFLEGIEDAMAARGFDLQLAQLADVQALAEREHLKMTTTLDL